MGDVTEVLSPALGAQWDQKLGILAELCPKNSPRCCGCITLLAPISPRVPAPSIKAFFEISQEILAQINENWSFSVVDIVPNLLSQASQGKWLLFPTKVLISWGIISPLSFHTKGGQFTFHPNFTPLVFLAFIPDLGPDLKIGAEFVSPKRGQRPWQDFPWSKTAPWVIPNKLPDLFVICPEQINPLHGQTFVLELLMENSCWKGIIFLEVLHFLRVSKSCSQKKKKKNPHFIHLCFKCRDGIAACELNLILSYKFNFGVATSGRNSSIPPGPQMPSGLSTSRFSLQKKSRVEVVKSWAAAAHPVHLKNSEFCCLCSALSVHKKPQFAAHVQPILCINKSWIFLQCLKQHLGGNTCLYSLCRCLLELLPMFGQQNPKRKSNFSPTENRLFQFLLLSKSQIFNLKPANILL